MDPGARKEGILKAASRVFATKGYHKASVSDITTEAGIARGTFYLYFKGKRDVFSELVDMLTIRLEACLRRVDLSPGKPPWEDQIRANVSRLASILLSERELTLILYNHYMGLDEEYDTKIREFYARITNAALGALRLGQQMRLLRPEFNPHLAALHMVGSVKEVIYHIAAYGEPDIPAEELVREMLEYHLAGIKTK